MKYIGPLFGKISPRRYFDTGRTSHEWDAMEQKIAELETEKSNLIAEIRHLQKVNLRNAVQNIQLERAGANLAAEFCLWCPHEVRQPFLRKWDDANDGHVIDEIMRQHLAEGGTPG